MRELTLPSEYDEIKDAIQSEVEAITCLADEFDEDLRTEAISEGELMLSDRFIHVSELLASLPSSPDRDSLTMTVDMLRARLMDHIAEVLKNSDEEATHDRATRYAQVAAAIYRSVGERRNGGTCLVRAAMLFHELGMDSESITSFTKALVAARAQHDDEYEVSMGRQAEVLMERYGYVRPAEGPIERLFKEQQVWAHRILFGDESGDVASAALSHQLRCRISCAGDTSRFL